MKKTVNKNLVGLLVSGAVIVGAPLIGLLVTVLVMRGAYGDVANPGVDPSQKARLLAEGISDAMNGTACGLIVSVLALVPTVIFAVRLHRNSKRGSGLPGPTERS